jgi:two-component system response regulator FixJ
MGGLELQAELLRRAVDVPFIVITGHGDVPSAVTALKTGAADFLEKPIDGGALLATLESAVARRRAHLAASHAAEAARERIDALTGRERDVLRHLVLGNPNKIIAYELGISPRTVENHRARLMVKMQAESLAELVRLALAAGVEAEAAKASRA